MVQDAFTSGGAQINLLNTENHIQLNEIVSWSSGKHFVKFGVNVPDWSRRGIDNHSNFGGTYNFSSLAAYAARMRELVAMRAWYAEGLSEPWRDAPHDAQIAQAGEVIQDLRA